MKEADYLSETAKALQEFHNSQQSLLLSTASEKGEPDISYAPFVRDEAGCFYIFVSDLAAHTANLQANPKASVMLIRPESESGNIFARERAVFNCKVREINCDEHIYTTQLTAFYNKFGEIVSLLRSLSDFHLFALCPQSGRYVAGFGRAYNVNVLDGALIPFDHKNKRES